MTSPLFERRHYLTLAELILTAPVYDSIERKRVARHFAAGLAKDNPRFVPDAFLKACGVE